MDTSFFDTLSFERGVYFFSMYLLYIIVIEIISTRRTFTIKRCVQIFTAALVITAVGVFSILLVTGFFFLSNIVIITIITLYIYILKKYNWQKSVTLGICVTILVSLCTQIGRLLLFAFIPETVVLSESAYYLVLVLCSYGVVIPKTILIVKATKRIRKRFNESLHFQTVFALIAITIYIVLSTVTELARWFGYALNSPMGVIVFLVLTLFALVYFVLAVIYLDVKREHRKKEEELKSLEYYISEIESQSIEIRKFKHDYQNILLSLETYIKDREIDKLESYFYNNIKKTAIDVNENEEKMQNIKKVKNNALKSVLVSKIQKAQSRHIDIEFEARDEIEEINLDIVILIRVVGILLDNAIEAVEEIGGTIRICMAKLEDDTLFFVSNTCNPDVIDLSSIGNEGYSTKEKGSGLGLSNLKDFSEKYSNLFVKTEIDDNQFIQTITIGGG